MRFWELASAATALVLSTSLNAAIITHGALTTNDDGSTNIITDTLNDYEWLRFDILSQMTYAQTLAVLDTQDGGGWNIAGQVQAHEFVDALFDPVVDVCTVMDRTLTGCEILNSWTDGAFGDNYDTMNDYAWFLNDDSSVGWLRIEEIALGKGSVDALNYFDLISKSDEFVNADNAISWLLYRDVPPVVVPVPAAIWLFGSGLLGLFGIARRKTRT